MQRYLKSLSFFLEDYGFFSLAYFFIQGIFLTDILMISRFDSKAIAAVGIVGSIVVLFSTFLLGFNSYLALSPLNYPKIYLKISLPINIAMVLVFTFICEMILQNLHLFRIDPGLIANALEYFRSSKYIFLPMVFFQIAKYVLDRIKKSGAVVCILLVTFCLNFLFDYILIFDALKIGIQGVYGLGIANVLTQGTAAIFVWILLIKEVGKHSFEEDFLFRRDILTFLQRSASLGLQNVVEVSTFLFLGILSSFLTAPEISSHQAAFKILNLLLIFPMGLTYGLSLKIKNIPTNQLFSYIAKLVLFGFSWCVLVFLLLKLKPDFIPNLFFPSNHEEGEILRGLLFLVVIFHFLEIVMGILVGLLRGLDLFSDTLLFYLGNFFAFNIFSYLVLTYFDAKITGLWIGLILGAAVSFSSYVYYLAQRFLRSNKHMEAFVLK